MGTVPSTSDEGGEGEDFVISSEEMSRMLLGGDRFFTTHITEDGPGQRASTTFTFDADKPFFTSVSTPSVMGSRLVDLKEAAAHRTTFVTQHNFVRPFCVRVTSSRTVTISAMPTNSIIHADLLCEIRAHMIARAKARGERTEIPDITFSAEVDGQVMPIMGVCDLTSWNPPTADKYTKLIKTIPHVVNVWECNGDAVPLNMEEAHRDSMRGHSVVIEQRTTDEHNLFIVQGISIHQLIMPPGEHVRFVWGGIHSSFNIFQPVVGTTSGIMNTAVNDMLPWDTWCKRFGNIETALQRFPNASCVRVQRAMLNPCTVRELEKDLALIEEMIIERSTRLSSDSIDTNKETTNSA